MSSFAHAPLDDSWLDDSDLENFSNADTDNLDSELDVSSDMLLPPEDFYTTQEELFDAIQAWAMRHKYAF